MWDIKYRPLKFADVLGQQGNIKLLKARLNKDTAFDTSYIFMGGHGQGKTSLARIHARAMLCQNLAKEDPEPCNTCESCLEVLSDQSPAFSERDAASQGKIENIRSIVGKLGIAIGRGVRMPIELFDEAHRIGDGAQDVLLKPLEEKQLVGMFCTTEPAKIKGTIRTRCEEYVIRKVTREDVLARAQHVCRSEGVDFEDDALLTIIDSSGGHVRDVINKMEMISQIGVINLPNTREYLQLTSVSTYYEILLALGNPKKAIALLEQVCENIAPADVASGIAEAAMNSFRLVNGMYADFVLVDRELGKKVYDLYNKEGTIRLADYFLTHGASRVSLMRDILLLTQLPGNLPPKGPPQTLILNFGGAEPIQVPQGVVPSPAAAVPAQATPVAPVATPVTGPTNPSNGYVEPDRPLHDYNPPGGWGERKKSLVNTTFVSKQPPEQGSRELQPEAWTRLFKGGWPGGFPGDRGPNA
jgi:DNA polymerase III subunit gamma/tau